MKKILTLIIFFAFFLLANNASANWYGRTGIGYSTNSTTSCPTDGDTTGGSNSTYGEAAVTTSGGSTPIGSRVAVGSSGTMYCLKWDSSVPGSLSVSYNNITTNASQVINYSANDRGGSRLKRVVLFQSQNGGAWTIVKDNDSLSVSNGTTYSSSYTKTPVSGSSFKYKVGAYDYAGNYSEFASSNVIFFDTINPSGLTIDYHNGWTNSQKVVTVTAKDTGGSKIKRILLQQSQNGGAWTNAADWDNLNWADNTITTRTFTRTFINRTDFKYRIYVYDYAGNSSTYASSNILRYENEVPTSLTLNYDNGWTNVNKNVTVTLKDTGGSKVKRILLQQSQNGGAWTNAADWDNLNWADNTTITRTFTRTLVNGSNFKYRYYAYDYAGNSSSLVSPSEIKFDNRIPTFADIIFPVQTNLLADESYSYTSTVSKNGNGMPNGGAPIVLINARSENNTDRTTYTPRSSINSTLAFTWDVRTVDGVSDRGYNGGREYSLFFDKICDAAGNCYNGGGVKNHFVYANTNSITKTIIANALDDNLVADGTDRSLTIQLLDNYGNQVVPASGISRNINMKFNTVTNTMFLNQYSRDPSGTKSVDVTRANSSTYSSTLFGGGNIVLNNEYSTNGNYVYKFRFYTPTANSYSTYTVSDPDAEFKIGSITFDVTQDFFANKNNLSIDLSSNITAKAKSLYNTYITGDINNNGLRAQTYQNGYITLSKEPGNNPTSGSVNFKFTDSSGKYTLTYGGGNPVSENDTLTYYKNINPFFTNEYISTYLRLDSTPAPSTTAGYFSTHISYSIGGKNVILNSDVIGRESYHGAATVDLVQSGLKVIGNIYDKDSKEVVVGQDVTSLGTIEKIDIKSDVVAQAYNFAKEVTYNQSTDGSIVNSIFGSTGGGKRVGNVIYFGDVDNNGANKIYQLGSGSDINVNDTKTILVIGGDLYIKSNMYYSGTHNLGIVVLKDKAGNGGKVYIDPGVTNIVGTIFAEKALISYNGSELDGNADASALKNQLHIYGSVFSYNTIGGSSLTPPECPYFETTCDLAKSFKYDLNYLRRYFLTKDGNTGFFKPAYSGNVSGGGTYNGNGTITGNNPDYARVITTTTDPYAKYSVIIEYNPTLKSVIPPFFNQR